MDGITTLQVITNTHLIDWATSVIIIESVLAFLLAIFVFLPLSIDYGIKNYYTIIILSIIILCIVIAIFIGLFAPKVTDITYRVLVDSNVNMNEFFSKYELIRTEGLIYVVREISGV